MFDLLGVAWQEYAKFIGSGLYAYIAYLSMIYLVFKKKPYRAVLVWAPLVLMAIFFNPLFIKVMYFKFFFGTYWRVLWLFPSTVIIAYTATNVICDMKHKRNQMLSMVAVALIIIGAGRFIYSTDNFEYRKNWYKLPKAAVEIGYNVKNYSKDFWYPTIIVPNELYCAMRQYSTHYKLLYGRDAEGYMSGIDEEDIRYVYEQMCSKTPNVEKIIEIARRYEVSNIIFNMDYHIVDKNLEKYGCYYVGDTDNYRYYTIVY